MIPKVVAILRWFFWFRYGKVILGVLAASSLILIVSLKLVAPQEQMVLLPIFISLPLALGVGFLVQVFPTSEKRSMTGLGVPRSVLLLPVSTRFLVAVPMVGTAVVGLSSWLFWVLLVNLVFGFELPIAKPAFAIVVVISWVHALSWSSWRFFFLVPGLRTFAAIFILGPLNGVGPGPTLETLPMEPLLPLGFVLVLAAYGCALLGAQRQRWEEPLFNRPFFKSRFVRKPRECRSFADSGAAYSWLNWRNSGRFLWLWTGLVLLIAYALLLLIPFSLIPGWMPFAVFFAVLPMVSTLCGSAWNMKGSGGGEDGLSGFERVLPLSDGALARARWLIAARSVILGFLCTLGLFLLWLFWSRHGSPLQDLIGLAGQTMSPVEILGAGCLFVFFNLVLSWGFFTTSLALRLWRGYQGMVAGSIVALLSFNLALIVYVLKGWEPFLFLASMGAWPFLAAMVVTWFWFYRLAIKKELLSGQTAKVILMVFAVVVTVSLYFLHQIPLQPQWVGVSRVGVLGLCIWGTYPFATVSLAVHKNRHP